MVPQYLCSLFPQNVGNTVHYDLRNNGDFYASPMPHRFVRKFVCSLISLWNSLPVNVRHLPTISSFKREISNIMFQTNTVPSYFSYRTRYLSVIHARLRNNCSDLKTIFFSITYLVIIVVTFVIIVRMPNTISSNVPDTVLNDFTFLIL